MRINHAFMIGAGGTGTHLGESLARLLAYHKDGADSLTIIDGDEYEKKNGERQLFDPSNIGVNKAEAMANGMEFMNEGIDIKHAPEFVDDDKFAAILGENVKDKDEMLLIILSVDNHASRNAIIRVLDREERQNFLLLSPGNSYDMGQVVVWYRYKGRNINLHPFKRFDDLEHPTDKIPGIGCAEEAVSTPQLISANFSAAYGCILLVQSFLDNGILHDELAFNVRTLKLVPFGDPFNVEVTDETLEKIDAKVAKAADERKKAMGGKSLLEMGWD